MFDLQTLSGMEGARYGEALKSLRDAGCIKRSLATPRSRSSHWPTARKLRSSRDRH